VPEYDRSTKPGATGTLLRREGMYPSHTMERRRARDAGTMSKASTWPRPGRNAEQVEIERCLGRMIGWPPIWPPTKAASIWWETSWRLSVRPDYGAMSRHPTVPPGQSAEGVRSPSMVEQAVCLVVERSIA
jgi:hypothetical protein